MYDPAIPPAQKAMDAHEKHTQHMRHTELGAFTSTVRKKLLGEAGKADAPLRLLVGHANMLDLLRAELQDYVDPKDEEAALETDALDYDSSDSGSDDDTDSDPDSDLGSDESTSTNADPADCDNDVCYQPRPRPQYCKGKKAATDNVEPAEAPRILCLPGGSSAREVEHATPAPAKPLTEPPLPRLELQATLKTSYPRQKTTSSCNDCDSDISPPSLAVERYDIWPTEHLWRCVPLPMAIYLHC